MIIGNDQLSKSALRDADQVRRLCHYLGSKQRLTNCDRDLLERAIEALTFWDDDGDEDETDPLITQIANEALRASDEGGGYQKWR